MKNPITHTAWGMFTSARVILDDKLSLKLLAEKKYSYISCISHNMLVVPSDVSTKKKKTVVIHLNGEIEDILASFNDTSRNEIRRTFREKALTFKVDDSDFDKIYTLYKLFRKEKKLPQHKPYYLKSARVFSAYYKGELVSVITVYDVHPYLRVQHIFSKNPGDDIELKKRIGYTTRRLIYEVCAFGASGGYQLLDLASVNLTDPKKRGITTFKQSFGGEIIDEYTYTYRSPIAKFVARFT